MTTILPFTEKVLEVWRQRFSDLYKAAQLVNGRATQPTPEPQQMKKTVPVLEDLTLEWSTSH